MIVSITKPILEILYYKRAALSFCLHMKATMRNSKEDTEIVQLENLV